MEAVMAHGSEYLAAAAGMAETYGKPFPPLGSIVWFSYGNGISSGKVLGFSVDLCNHGAIVVRVQRSASEILEVETDRLQPPPRFFQTNAAAPVVGQLVWFTIDGGQCRGVVEQVAPDGSSFLVRSSESGEVVEVAALDVLNF
jgi:hypothetical protein